MVRWNLDSRVIRKWNTIYMQWRSGNVKCGQLPFEKPGSEKRGLKWDTQAKGVFFGSRNIIE